MTISLQEQLEREFLAILRDILNSEEKIDIAVKTRASAFTNGDFIAGQIRGGDAIGLSTLHEYGAFDENGQENIAHSLEFGITYEFSRIHGQQKVLGDTIIKNLSLRENLILDSVLSLAQQELLEKYKEKIEDIPFIGMLRQVPIKIVSELRSSFVKDNRYKFLIPPTSNAITPQMKQALNQGIFHFNETNILISPGPFIKDNQEESDRKLDRFFDNLKREDVRQVFAIGRAFPYFAQDKDSGKVNEKAILIEDFTNYFIPSLDGTVNLPEPYSRDYRIHSKAVEKVGRITTYEIMINEGPPIYVHHFPLRDKQPLNLTDEELDYVKDIQQTTNQNHNILTHCRQGKGRSAQMAFILAANTEKYKQDKDEDSVRSSNRLKQMRKEKTGFEESESFVETSRQKDYLENIEDKLHSSSIKYTKLEQTTFDFYAVISLLFKEEMEQNKAYASIKELAKGTSIIDVGLFKEEIDIRKTQEKCQFLELYHRLQEQSTVDELSDTLQSAQKLSFVSKRFKDFDLKNLIKDQLVNMLTESIKPPAVPINKKLIYDIAVENLSYSTITNVIFIRIKSEVQKQTKMMIESLPANEQEKEKRNIDNHNSLNFRIAKIHIMQAYLRTPDVNNEILTDLTMEIEKLSGEFDQIEQENHSGNDMYRVALLKKYAVIFDELKKAERLLAEHRKTGKVQEKYSSDSLFKSISDQLDRLERRHRTIIDNIALTTLSHSEGQPQTISENKPALELLKIKKPEEILEQVTSLQKEIIKRIFDLQSKDVETFLTQACETLDIVLRESDSTQHNPIVTFNEEIFTKLKNDILKLKNKPLNESGAKGEIFHLIVDTFFHIAKAYNLEDVKFAETIRKDTERAKQQKLRRENLLTRRVALKEQENTQNAEYKSKTKPKLILFEVDDILVDLSREEIKNEKWLFPLLRKIKETMPDTEIAICSNRTSAIDKGLEINNSYSLSRLVEKIYQETGCIIKKDFQLDYSKELQKPMIGFSHVYRDAIQRKDTDKADQFYHYLIQEKNYQLDELRQRYESLHKELPNESECIFVDANPAYEVFNNTSHYRVIKAPTGDNSNIECLMNIAYEAGLYEAFIEYLKNKGKGSADSDDLIFFQEFGFKHTPIVKDISLNDFYAIIEKLPGERNQEKNEEYKYDFTASAISHYSALSDKENTASAAYSFIGDQMKTIKAKMEALVSNRPNDINEQLTKLIEVLNKLIALQELFNEHIGSHLDKASTNATVAQTTTDVLNKYDKLIEFKALLHELKKISPSTQLDERLIKNEKITNHNSAMDGLLQTVNDAIEDPQYQAMQFLIQAKKYITSLDRKWKVGYQWHEHVIEGTAIRIPTHVDKQLKEIADAERDGNYVKHMHNFIEIGQKQAKKSSIFSFSSASSKNYFKLFKGPEEEKALAAQLKQTFNPKSRNGVK